MSENKKEWTFTVINFKEKTREITGKSFCRTKAMTEREFKKLLKRDLPKYKKYGPYAYCIGGFL